MTPRNRHGFIALAATLCAICGTAQANFIDSGLDDRDGDIAFGGFNVTGLSGSEDLAGLVGAPVTFYDIIIIPSTPADPLWTIDSGGVFTR